jgi:hypothetical protein
MRSGSANHSTAKVCLSTVDEDDCFMECSAMQSL